MWPGYSDIPWILIPVCRYELPNTGTKRQKYTFIYSYIFYCRLCFFLLNLDKVCFQVRKHTLSIVNHPKALKTCSLKGFYQIDDLMNFRMELLGASVSPGPLVVQVTVCPKILWINHKVLLTSLYLQGIKAVPPGLPSCQV